MAKQHKFFAVVIPGLERIAARELASLSAHDIEIEYGGVSFTGTLSLLYRVNLRARTITRVLMRLRTFRSMTLEGLRYDLEKVAWHLFFNENTRLEVEVNTHHSRLNHSDEVADFSKETILKCLPKTGTKEQLHTQTLHIRIDNNRGVLSLDTSGERLDRRGYRLESGKAPLRETIASAMIQWSGWTPEQSLLTPMCGSGTIAIEAALMGLNKAPNLEHDFSFLHFASFKDKEFKTVHSKCLAMQKEMTLHIAASDNHDSALEVCAKNIKRAGVSEAINVEKMDIHQLEKPTTEHGGVLILNPPYGLRIGDEKKVLSLWVDMGKMIRQQFLNDDTWKTIIICPDATHEKALGLPVKKRLKLKHGGLDAMFIEV
ncbi:MAG: RNA methyltransferase [Ghiorsea sp.]|nr:RNA methyltransferase [Ghiorsea sp.]